MDLIDVQQDLLRTARELPSDALFSKDSSMEFARLVAQGANRMVADGRTGESDLKLARAQLAQLIEAMNEERSARSLAYFSETTLASARNRLCPGFWPFC
jgi:hypothetical protein